MAGCRDGQFSQACDKSAGHFCARYRSSFTHFEHEKLLSSFWLARGDVLRDVRFFLIGAAHQCRRTSHLMQTCPFSLRPSSHVEDVGTNIRDQGDGILVWQRRGGVWSRSAFSEHETSPRLASTNLRWVQKHVHRAKIRKNVKLMILVESSALLIVAQKRRAWQGSYMDLPGSAILFLYLLSLLLQYSTMICTALVSHSWLQVGCPQTVGAVVKGW